MIICPSIRLESIITLGCTTSFAFKALWWHLGILLLNFKKTEIKIFHFSQENCFNTCFQNVMIKQQTFNLMFNITIPDKMLFQNKRCNLSCVCRIQYCIARSVCNNGSFAILMLTMHLKLSCYDALHYRSCPKQK